MRYTLLSVVHIDGLPYRRGLCELVPDVYAFLQPPGSWGWSNAGIVAGDGESLLVDTFYTLALTRELLAAVELVSSGPVAAVVNTHLNGDHCWGNQLLPDVEIVTSERCAFHAGAEVDPETMLRFGEVPGLVGAYLDRHFKAFDFAGVKPVPPTRTFSGSLPYGVGGHAIELVEVGPAHTSGDVVVYLPESGVVFTGDVVFVGDHPVAWTGPLTGWIGACDRLLAMGAGVFVPGHGPVTDRAGVADFRGYLEAVAEFGRARARAGTPLLVAAREFVCSAAGGRYAGWGLPERLVTVLAAAYCEVEQSTDMRPMVLAELMAALAEDQT